MINFDIVFAEINGVIGIYQELIYDDRIEIGENGGVSPNIPNTIPLFEVSAYPLCALEDGIKSILTDGYKFYLYIVCDSYSGYYKLIKLNDCQMEIISQAIVKYLNNIH